MAVTDDAPRILDQQPLVTINFESLAPDTYGRSTQRHWYHVPRVGDDVEFGEGDDFMSGTVTVVMWGDRRDGPLAYDVVVRFK